MRSAGAIPIAVGLVALALAGPAAAAGLRPVGKTVDAVVSDGARWVAFSPDYDTTRVIDTRTNRSFDVATPDGCSALDPNSTDLGASGVLAIGGGQLVWGCEPDDPVGQEPLRMLNLHTRRVHKPAGLDAMLAGEGSPHSAGSWSLRWRVVGTHWIVGRDRRSASEQSEERTIAYNWRSGRVRHNWPASARAVPDPDLPALRRRICRPMRRTRSPFVLGETLPPFVDFQYDQPFGLEQVVRIAHGTETDTLALGRCGSSRRRPLGQYLRDSEQLGGGRVSWYYNAYVRLFDARSGRTRRWPFRVNESLSLAHTRTMLYAARKRLGARTLYAVHLSR